MARMMGQESGSGVRGAGVGENGGPWGRGQLEQRGQRGNGGDPLRIKAAQGRGEAREGGGIGRPGTLGRYSPSGSTRA